MYFFSVFKINRLLLNMNNKYDNSTCNCLCCDKQVSDDSSHKFVKLEDQVFLCESCIDKMHTEVFKNKSSKSSEDEILTSIPKTKEIYNYLNKHVIGQDEAKKQLSIAVNNHFKRIKEPSINKSNVLLIGPTGTGKTELVRAVSQYVKIPFVSVDATTLTTRGYIGEGVESIIERLLQQCDYNVSKAQKGIIVVDEIDKLASSQNNDSSIGTTSVQQELLKLFEGSVVKVSRNGRQILVDTKNILFICAGSFVGLKDLVVPKKSPAGIGLISEKSIISLKEENWFNSLTTESLIKYGFIPEFLGRLPIIVQTHELSKSDFLKIMTEPENSIISQYKKLLKMDNIEVDFSEEFLEMVVEKTFTTNLGARGVRKILEENLKELLFNSEEYEGKIVIINNGSFSVAERERRVFLMNQK